MREVPEMKSLNQAFGIVVAVAAHPRLWGTAVRVGRRSVPRRWWRSAPYLPVPSPAYVAFRMQTQYGSEGPNNVADDVIEYLRWCRLWDRGA